MNKLLPKWDILLAAALVITVGIMVAQLWGTAFTCDDDFFTATASQRWGDGDHGLTAIANASWTASVNTGRFYQLIAYTLTQLPYSTGSFEVVNLVRILCLLTVFGLFTATLASTLKSFQLAAFMTTLCAALIETKYNYNSFHGYPMWFTLGFAFLLFSVLCFQEGLRRKSFRLQVTAGIGFFCSLLFYESFLLYLPLFVALAFIDSRLRFDSISNRIRHTCWMMPYLAVPTAIYVVIYIGFSHAYPSQYEGRALSLGNAFETIQPIVGFSVTGLNLRHALSAHLAWNIQAAIISAIVFCVVLLSVQHFRAKEERAYWTIAAIAAVCMLLPNLMYGFVLKYREWPRLYDAFYLGSFFSAFAEALLLGTVAIILARIAGHIRLGGICAAIFAIIFAYLAYLNVDETTHHYQVYRDDRKYWDMVDAVVAQNPWKSLSGGILLVEPTLASLPQVNPGKYDYWSFYIGNKLGKTVRTVNSWSDLDSAVDETKALSLYGLTARYYPELQAGFITVGSVNADTWRKDPVKLPVSSAEVYVVGDYQHLTVASSSDKTWNHPAERRFRLEQPSGLDLNSLVLRRDFDTRSHER